MKPFKKRLGSKEFREGVEAHRILLELRQISDEWRAAHPARPVGVQFCGERLAAFIAKQKRRLKRRALEKEET